MTPPGRCYSYLAAPGALRLETDFKVTLAFRPVLDLAAMDAAIADPASHRAEVEASQAAWAEAGHWGAPTFVIENEPFFGENRIDTLRWRLAKLGLQQRQETWWIQPELLDSTRKVAKKATAPLYFEKSVTHLAFGAIPRDTLALHSFL